MPTKRQPPETNKGLQPQLSGASPEIDVSRVWHANDIGLEALLRQPAVAAQATKGNNRLNTPLCNAARKCVTIMQHAPKEKAFCGFMRIVSA